MKKKYVINRQDYFLTEKQVLNLLEKFDKTYITDGFIMDYEDEISLDLNTKIQVLLENQEGYNRAISYENKIYYDQLDRTSDDPEIKQKGPIMTDINFYCCVLILFLMIVSIITIQKGPIMKTVNLFKKLCSNNLEHNKRQEIKDEIKSRMEHNKPFTVDDFNSFANWYNKKNESEV